MGAQEIAELVAWWLGGESGNGRPIAATYCGGTGGGAMCRTFIPPGV